MKQSYTTLKQQLFELRYNLKLSKNEEDILLLQNQVHKLKKLIAKEMIRKCDILKK